MEQRALFPAFHTDPARPDFVRARWRVARLASAALCLIIILTVVVVIPPNASGEARTAPRGLPKVRPVSLGPISKTDVREFLRIQGPTPVNAIEGDRFVALLKNNVKVTYTFDTKLQRAMERYFKKRSVQYGAFVAIEPSTGRVLSLVSYARPKKDGSRPTALRATFPAASIFKIVTVAAALQEEKVTPNTVIRFRGGYWSMNRSVLRNSKRRDRRRLTVAEALGLSCNHCFGKVAINSVGTSTLRKYTNAFGFNTPFNFELPIETSRASIPRDRYQLARTGAGFGDVYFSPLHAALMAATIANGGRMMEPSVIEKIEDANGRLLYRPRQRIVATPVSPGVARQINQMMVKTIEKGTARRVFKTFSARHPYLEISGKTGSLSGKNPPGHNYWFIGSGPVDNPTIAVAALVIPRSGHRLKGNQVARAAFETYFGK